jgi:hypothetical protein
MKPGDFSEGDTVEWATFNGIDRGVVHKVTESRVYVRNQRTGSRGRARNKVYDCEFWWDSHELDQLRRTEGQRP